MGFLLRETGQIQPCGSCVEAPSAHPGFGIRFCRGHSGCLSLPFLSWLPHRACKVQPASAEPMGGRIMTSQAVLVDVSCAVEVFLATALLHQEQTGRNDFTIQEIVNRAARENITGEMRSGENVHASQHCVANKAPNPAKHRMLFATGRSTRRLLLPGDQVDPGRTGKIFPEADEVPEKYLPVLEWAKDRYDQGLAAAGNWPLDPDERIREL